MSRHKKTVFTVITFLMVFSLAEGLAYVASSILEGRGVFYRLGDVSNAEAYLARRDPVLGWPAPDEFGRSERYDVSGARPTPSFPDPGGACVSVYGDSFTVGGGVSDEAAWPNQLSQLLGCRVANDGTGEESTWHPNPNIASKRGSFVLSS